MIRVEGIAMFSILQFIIAAHNKGVASAGSGGIEEPSPFGAT